ncbi:EGFR-coamplified and overexpressed protein -like protein [Triplophysa tibetana]|uniref:WW domain binding protein VOPP1 n=1 Tax=Triplophysa tibetana TaxID=1572043 RepID=A0A5A9PB28_9TELE|nr:EGFR-coamplified and overexpressed protein -like protein [Triplophysa tibetana]
MSYTRLEQCSNPENVDQQPKYALTNSFCIFLVSCDLLLLLIGIVSCCGAGYFIRRRVHTYTLPDGPDFNVTFTRHPILSPGLRHFGFQSYGDAETTVTSTAYPVRTHSAQVTTVYPVLPPYYSQPPPSYDQAIKDSQRK